MKKRLMLCLLLMAMLLSLLAGCGKEKKEEEYQIFYLNTDVTKIVPQTVELEHTSGMEQVEELISCLQSQPEDAGMRQTIPSDVKVLGITDSDYQLSINFSKEYYKMEATEEILTRAAVVKTLLQVKGYLYVSFTVESEPLINGNGVIVGSMGVDSFLENPGQQISPNQKTTLTLYFSDKSGMNLVAETREVHHSSNISLEKLVMEQLIEGPKNRDLLATVPSGTKLITITVVDGVCYVNLDEMFLNQNQEIKEEVILYSVVNSLTELPDVDKVQISINGDTSGKCRFTYDLSTMYEADPSIIVNENEEVESTE